MKLRSKIKSIFGVALAALMTVSAMAVSLPVGAAQGGTITVNAPANGSYTLEGMTFTAYEVLVKEDSGNYTVASDFESFFGTLAADYDDTAAAKADLYVRYDDASNQLVWADQAGSDTVTIPNGSGNKLDAICLEASLLSKFTTSNAGANRTLANWLSKYVTANASISGTVLNLSSDHRSASGTMASAGYYFVKMTTNGTNPIAIQDNVLLLDGTAVTIDTKVDTVDVVKTVQNAGDTSGQATEKDTAAIGDILNYTIVIDIPDFTNYVNPTLTVGDTLSHQVLYTTVTENADFDDYFTLTGEGGTELPLTGADSVLKANTSEINDAKDGFTFDFDTGKLTAYYGKTLTLTYQAALTEDAVGVNENNVTLTYSNDPYDAAGTDTADDKTEVYTYGLHVTKTFSDGSTDKMNQVEFNLKQGETVLEFVELTAGSGQYRVATKEDTNPTSSLKPSAEQATMGRLQIIGLDTGSYTLVETSAISGYNKAEVEITLADGEPDGALDQNATTATENEIDLAVTIGTGTVSVAQFNVVNNKTTDLPTTGGAGTWMFTMGGLVLIAGAVALLVVVRRKKAK